MALEILIGVAVGLSLGLTGGGGSIFAVPLLVYTLGLSIQDAVPLALVVVAVTSVLGLLMVIREGAVAWRAGIVFSLGGIFAAPLGTWLGSGFNQDIRLISFALLMVLVGVSMWRKAVNQPGEASIVRGNIGLTTGSRALCTLSPSGKLRFSTPCAMVLSASGVLVGVLAGVFGVGGGFLIVPALVFVTQMTTSVAVATSLMVISVIGAAGAASALLQSPEFLWRHQSLLGLFLTGSLLGMVFGRVMSGRLAGPTLQKLFSVMVLATAVFILIGS